MEGLNLNNILTGDEVDTLFDKYTSDSDDNTTEEPQEQQEETTEETVDNNDKDTTEVSIDDIFAPESVGSDDEDIQGGQEDTDSSKQGTSPNFYSSIAKALKEEGIFPDLDDDNEVKSAEDFKDLIQKQIEEGLDETQKRINEALNANVPVDSIKMYENTIKQLSNVTEEQLSEESEDMENFRKSLIYQDLINRGYSQQKAEKEVQKSINAGTDIDDAIDALQSNIQFYKTQYQTQVNSNKAQMQAAQEAQKKEFESLSKIIMEDSKAFGDFTVDKKTRKKILDNIFKPSYTDQKTGAQYTELQRYATENRAEFLKNFGLAYTLTNGFKDMNGLLKSKVKKEVNKGLKELEHTLRGNSSKTFDGNLKLMNESPETSFRGWDLDL